MRLGYFPIRGIVQPIRLLLAFVGETFVNEFYPLEFDRLSQDDPTTNQRFVISALDFPYLPYLIDNGVKITQDIAIHRYLSRKFNLEPKTDWEKRRLDQVEQVILKYRSLSRNFFHNPLYVGLIPSYRRSLQRRLDKLSKFLGHHRFFSGGGVTYGDFMVYEWIDQHRLWSPDLLEEYDNLKSFMKRVEKLPGVNRYMSSPEFIDWPLFEDDATFGSRFTPKPVNQVTTTVERSVKMTIHREITSSNSSSPVENHSTMQH